MSATASIAGNSFTTLAIAPQDHATIYAGGPSGLWVSHDSATTWKQVLAKIAVSGVYLDPSNPANIFVAGAYSGNGKIVQTTDSGASWSEVYNDSTSGTVATGIAANPTNAQELVASLSDGTVIASPDGGKTWSVATQFSGDVALELRASKLNSELYLLLQNKGLQQSTDGGHTWTSLVGQLTQSSFSFTSTNFLQQPVSSFYTFALDLDQAGTVYLATAGGLYKTTDNGGHWTFVTLPASTPNNWPHEVASTDGGMVAYTSIGSTMFKTLDSGATWQTDELPAGVASVGAIAIDPTLPQVTYVGSGVASRQ